MIIDYEKTNKDLRKLSPEKRKIMLLYHFHKRIDSDEWYSDNTVISNELLKLPVKKIKDLMFKLRRL